jgi:uncharacterized protein (DUF433 family)
VTVPPITPREATVPGATFFDLIEVVAIGKFREKGFSIAAVRRLVNVCQTVLGVARPLTSLVFKTEGYRVFVENAGELIEVLRTPGQTAWNEILEPFLETLDYRADRVATWWPQGRSAGIRVDPAWGWGRPVVARRGVRTDILLEHWEAGESIADIATDYELTPMEVESALRFELSLRKSA